MEKFISFAGHYRDLTSFVAPLLAAGLVVFQLWYNAKQNLKATRQQIYQALELASINLFRFECEHSELVAGLWYPKSDVSRRKKSRLNLVRHYQLREYICQILNLFEMACRFRRDNIFEADIFRSWEIWMWELCQERVFQIEWEDGALSSNYIPHFRQIMNTGIQMARKPGADAVKRRQFFEKLAVVMGDGDFFN